MLGRQAGGQRGAAVGRQRRLLELAGERAAALHQARGHQLVGEVLERLHQEVERAGDEDHAVAALAMRADAAHGGVVHARQDEVAQRALRTLAQLVAPAGRGTRGRRRG